MRRRCCVGAVVLCSLFTKVLVAQEKLPEFFGPAYKEPFNDKIFRAPGVPSVTAKQPATAGLPPLPPGDRVITVPDGSLPPPPPPKIWTGGFEFGINGSQGNTDVFAMRIGANADRKTESNVFHTDFLYTTNQQNGLTNQNQAIFNMRDEIILANSPWSVFSAFQLEYDEFRIYDFRIGLYAGFGYTWLKNDTTLFKTRLGAGVVREIATGPGATPDRWVPEALLGADFNHKFTDRQAFISSVDLYPSLSDFGQYRLRARAGYEILLDPEYGLAVRLGVQNRYDSNPGPAKRNDLNYFVTLLFKF